MRSSSTAWPASPVSGRTSATGSTPTSPCGASPAGRRSGHRRGRGPPHRRAAPLRWRPARRPGRPGLGPPPARPLADRRLIDGPRGPSQPAPGRADDQGFGGQGPGTPCVPGPGAIPSMPDAVPGPGPPNPMPQSIPKGLTRDAVLQALADLDAGVDHPFGAPTGYELVHEGTPLPAQGGHRPGLPPPRSAASCGPRSSAAARPPARPTSCSGSSGFTVEQQGIRGTADESERPGPGPATRST